MWRVERGVSAGGTDNSHTLPDKPKDGEHLGPVLRFIAGANRPPAGSQADLPPVFVQFCKLRMDLTFVQAKEQNLQRGGVGHGS